MFPLHAETSIKMFPDLNQPIQLGKTNLAYLEREQPLLKKNMEKNLDWMLKY